MEELSFLNLMIIFSAAGQEISLSSANYRDAASVLLLRQKRASSPSNEEKEKTMEMTESPSSSAARVGYLHPPRPNVEVGKYNPGRWVGRLDPGMVRINRGNVEIGLGVIATPRRVITKAHLIPDTIRFGKFRIEFSDMNGNPVSHIIWRGEKKEIAEEQQQPWGRNDVCIVEIMPPQEMPVAKPVSGVLQKTRIFTLQQILWAGSVTGCLDSPKMFDL